MALEAQRATRLNEGPRTYESEQQQVSVQITVRFLLLRCLCVRQVALLFFLLILLRVSHCRRVVGRAGAYYGLSVPGAATSFECRHSSGCRISLQAFSLDSDEEEGEEDEEGAAPKPRREGRPKSLKPVSKQPLKVPSVVKTNTGHIHLNGKGVRKKPQAQQKQRVKKGEKKGARDGGKAREAGFNKRDAAKGKHGRK